MSKGTLVLLSLLAGIGALLFAQQGEIRRYLKIEQM